MTQYWQPNQGTASTPPPPVYKCRVCGGKGYTFFEVGNGQPTQQRSCAYCGGSGTDQWVHANHAKAARQHNRRAICWRVGAIVYVSGVLLTNALPAFSLDNSGVYWPLIHLFIIWPLAIFAVCRLVITTPAWKRHKAGKAANRGDGFTTNEERLLGGAFLAGSVLKFQHDQRVRQQQQFQDGVTDYMRRHP